MNQENRNTEEPETESVRDLDVTDEQAAQTKAGIRLPDLYVTGFSTIGSSDRPSE